MIPFNRPHATGKELAYIQEACANRHLSGDGPFTRRCHNLIERVTWAQKSLLTHSCTAALEMAAILIDIKPGDEVIMPSYTFVSTANAFVLRGGVPVFVDVRPDTLNIDENLIEEAITERTRAICVVHYAGVGCEMSVILRIADKHGIVVLEDAAQGICSKYEGRPLGSMGALAAVSFHETKNVISGEGGALLINSSSLIERAEIIREKGTDRAQFFRGQIDKYTWVDIGSSYLPSELVAAFLAAQLEDLEEITARRLALWSRYYEWAKRWEQAGIVRRPAVPDNCTHNAHMFYMLLPDLRSRTDFLSGMKEAGLGAVFHYVPLHCSPAGKRYGRAVGDMMVTNDCSERLVRMPMWLGLEDRFDEVLLVADRLLRAVV